MRSSLLLVFCLLNLFLSAQDWKPINGTKNELNHYTAFTNANIFLESGTYLQGATLLIKDQEIVDIGKTLILPSNTIVHDLEGKFIYPSFIDLYSQYGIPEYQNNSKSKNPQLESDKKGLYYWNETIKPEIRAADLFQYNKKSADHYRKMGYGVVLSHQMDGIVRGTSVALALSDEKKIQILKSEAAAQYSFFKGKSKQTNPNSLMGMIALIRQLNYDLNWYKEMGPKREVNLSLEAMERNKDLVKIMDAGNTASILRADKLGDEFGIQFIIKGNGTAYQRIDSIKATNANLIVPINFPKAYDVSNPFDAQQLSLGQMKAWEAADENIVHIDRANIPFTVTAHGLKQPIEFNDNLIRVIKKGMNRERLIQQMSLKPAEWLGIADRVGSLIPGKLANFIVCSDSLFKTKSEILSNWVAGKEFIIKSQQEIQWLGEYSLNIDKKSQFDLIIEGSNEKPRAKISIKNEQAFKSILFSTEDSRMTIAFESDGVQYQLGGNVSDDRSRIWTGKTILKEKWVEWAAIKKKIEELKTESKRDSLVQEKIKLAKITYPNKAYGWDSIPKNSEAIVFRNATIWTNEEDGILRNHDLVIFDGKIQMVGYKINLEIMFPEKHQMIREIDLKGKHLTSGIIDEHSHIAIEKGVNEASQAITAEVRIGDVINGDDINIYRQLSGGVTAVQLLHGSANPIGGQSALIKLRWGRTGEGMKIKDADGFIKFALGENVKQSNWGDHQTIRFPQTRMGVEQVFYDGFHRAKEYQEEQHIFESKNKKEKKGSVSPRIDLELEALAEILDSQRFISCHSYMQNEINMLMHVADSMGFQVNTFTHILEGYKVADKMREHEVAASTFSDWWAYKFEVNDAIPYNGALLHKQGVLTGFNSDDAEMGRRLNQEAAKAVKYGGISEKEAWKFVTLNPAKMLHLDDRMGSIKVGKDADLVIWSGNPLSIYTIAESTYIDGIKYFDLARDKQLRKQITKERARIIALMINEKKKGKPTQKVKKEKKVLYECDTIEILD